MPTAHKPIVHPTSNVLDFPNDVKQCADIRQGPLGTCWLIAPLIAAEVVSPGFADRLVVLRSHDRAVVDFACGPISTDVPASTRGRSGTRAGRLGAATVVEAAAQTLLGPRLEGHLPSFGFRLLFGSAGFMLPALPGLAPMAVRAALRALGERRPVVAATLPGSESFELDRADPSAAPVRITPNHVYAVVGSHRAPSSSPRSPGRPQLLRRNPVLTGRTDIQADALRLSPDQLAEASMTVFIGPKLSRPRKAGGAS